MKAAAKASTQARKQLLRQEALLQQQARALEREAQAPQRQRTSKSKFNEGTPDGGLCEFVAATLGTPAHLLSAQEADLMRIYESRSEWRSPLWHRRHLDERLDAARSTEVCRMRSDNSSQLGRRLTRCVCADDSLHRMPEWPLSTLRRREARMRVDGPPGRRALSKGFYSTLESFAPEPFALDEAQVLGVPRHSERLAQQRELHATLRNTSPSSTQIIATGTGSPGAARVSPSRQGKSWGSATSPAALFSSSLTTAARSPPGSLDGTNPSSPSTRSSPISRTFAR